jgi:hypothetical protein
MTSSLCQPTYVLGLAWLTCDNTMRLLNTETVKLHDFFGRKPPSYAILSHRWEEDEVSYKDVMKGRNLEASGWTKVRQCCTFVHRQGFEWVWIDTCCIDKRSSSELTESINSMYKWYQGAKVCFVYLTDVQCRHEEIHSYKQLAPTILEIYDRATSQERQPEPIAGQTIDLFRRSKWFTRRWTLQELLAPDMVIFLDNGWNMFGSKAGLKDLVSDITGIADVASAFVLNASVATRMSWAAGRNCTRPEDMAYGLLGIFEANMPLIYGEGEIQAFERLQLEIIKRSGDESIFAFHTNENWTQVLARHPRNFARCAGIRPFEPRTPRAPYSCTPKGLDISTILLPTHWSTYLHGSKIYFMPLNCAREGALKPMTIQLARKNEDVYFRISIDDYNDRDHGRRWPEEAELDLTADIKTVKIHIVNYDSFIYQKSNLINDENALESLRAAVDKYMPTNGAVGKREDEKKATTYST